MVAVQLRRFSGEEGKAETPGEGESINWRSSVWRLVDVSVTCLVVVAQK